MAGHSFLHGYLKQQCLDSSGLYEWIKKRYYLDVEAGSLTIFVSDCQDIPQSNLDLTGAKYSKEWSVLSAVAGYGFDIVWSSGKIWSFLAEDESSCRSWVTLINQSIATCSSKMETLVGESIARSQDDFKRLLKLSPPALQSEQTGVSSYSVAMRGDQSHHLWDSNLQPIQGMYPTKTSWEGEATSQALENPFYSKQNDRVPYTSASYSDNVLSQPAVGDENASQQFKSTDNLTGTHYDIEAKQPLYYRAGADLYSSPPGKEDSRESSRSHSRSLDRTAVEFQTPVNFIVPSSGQNHYLHAEGNGNANRDDIVDDVPPTVPRYQRPQAYDHSHGHVFQAADMLGRSTAADLQTDKQQPADHYDYDYQASSPRSTQQQQQQQQQQQSMLGSLSISGIAAEGSGSSSDASPQGSQGSQGSQGTVGSGSGSGMEETKDSPPLPLRGLDSGPQGAAATVRTSLQRTFAMEPHCHDRTHDGDGNDYNHDDVQYEQTRYQAVDAPPLAMHGGPVSGMRTSTEVLRAATERGAQAQGIPTYPTATAAASVRRSLSASRDAGRLQETQSPDQALEIEALILRVKQLTTSADRERKEAEAARELSAHLQRERDEAQDALAQLNAALKEKERLAFQTAQNDLHARVARAANEGDLMHEAALRVFREQHQREMSCLRDELAAERKRYAESLTRETQLRDEAERKEFDLRRENVSLRDQNVRVQAELRRMQETLRDENQSRDREKDSAIQAADDRVAALQDERDSLLARAQSEQRLRITELTQRYGVSLQDMEISIRETVRQEITAEKMQEMALMQRRCSKEVEAARLEERSLAARELEEVRKTYAEREARTSEDLAELEKLHGNRVSRLEAQVAALKDRAEAAEARMNESVLELNKAVEESRGGNERHLRQLEEYARRADALARDLEHAHTEVQESRVKEMGYREQLTRVLEEARVRHAELAELRRQSTDRSAQASLWRRAASEIDQTQATTTTQLQIAREEVAMLEHELRRAKDEAAGLRRALGSADRLVYGAFSPYSHLAPQGPLGLVGSSSGPGGYGHGHYSEEDQRAASAAETHRGGTYSYADPTTSSSSKSPRITSASSTSVGVSRRTGAGAVPSPFHSKAKLIQHPPWRPGFCNCSCKGSGCRCHGHGAPCTSSVRPNFLSRPNSPAKTRGLAMS